jgi:hypothetical protein
MRAPPDTERAAPAASGNGSLETDHAGELISLSNKRLRYREQARVLTALKSGLVTKEAVASASALPIVA